MLHEFATDTCRRDRSVAICFFDNWCNICSSPVFGYFFCIKWFLNIVVRAGAIVKAVSFITNGLILSGPGALCGLISWSSLVTPLIVMSNIDKTEYLQLSKLLFIMMLSVLCWSVRGFCSENTDWNWLFSAVALSIADVTSMSFCVWYKSKRVFLCPHSH